MTAIVQHRSLKRSCSSSVVGAISQHPSSPNETAGVAVAGRGRVARQHGFAVAHPLWSDCMANRCLARRIGLI